MGRGFWRDVRDLTARSASKHALLRQPAPDWGRACLTRQLQRLAGYPADKRRAVVAAGYDLGGVVAGGHLDLQLARDSLLTAALGLYDHEPGQYRELERTIVSCLERGGRKPKYPPPLRLSGREAVAEQLLVWESTARGRAWSGRGGPGRLALLLGMYRTASKVGRVTLSESLRELQGMAGHSSHSVTANALKALEQAGWLRRLERGSRQATQGRSLWELLPPPDAEPDSSVAACGLREPVESSDQTTSAVGWLDPAHDCWHQRQTAWRIAAWLSEHAGSSVSGVARALGVHRSTVRRQLVWLVTEQLVLAVDVGGRERVTYQVVTAPELAAAHSAESWSVSPAQVRQQRWQRDRESWSRWLQALAEQRERDRLQRAWERSRSLESVPVSPLLSTSDLHSAYDSEQRQVIAATGAPTPDH